MQLVFQFPSPSFSVAYTLHNSHYKTTDSAVAKREQTALLHSHSSSLPSLADMGWNNTATSATISTRWLFVKIKMDERWEFLFYRRGWEEVKLSVNQT
jgi:hypothetical protein